MGILLAALALAHPAQATDRFVAPSGSDGSGVSPCDSGAKPCLTLQQAVSQSAAGDAIHLASGTYANPGIVTIDRTVSLLGARAGVDARTRTGAESVLSVARGISITASGVALDGLTIQDSTEPFGVWLGPGVDGTRIVNTVFKNSASGLGLANLGNSPCVIQHNLFQGNNLGSLSASGTGIYTDQYVGGSVSNVLIEENKFTGQSNAGIALANLDESVPDSGITISNNIIDGCGRGLYAYNTSGSRITGNTFTRLTAPADGGSSAAIGIFGANAGLTVTGNHLESGPKFGIFIANAMASNNSYLNIHENNIFGFGGAGMRTDIAPSGPGGYATCNWWGAVSGPANAALNPGGTGDGVIGDLAAANFALWLGGFAPGTPCAQP